MNAYTIAVAFKARFGADGWACEDLAPGTGETPIAGLFVKERCRKTAEGQNVVVESRYYYKPGQGLIDPNTGLPDGQPVRKLGAHGGGRGRRGGKIAPRRFAFATAPPRPSPASAER